MWRPPFGVDGKEHRRQENESAARSPMRRECAMKLPTKEEVNELGQVGLYAASLLRNYNMSSINTSCKNWDATSSGVPRKSELRPIEGGGV